MKLYPTRAKHFIYTISDPRTGVVMYAGCTLKPEDRFRQHRWAIRKPVGMWIEELKADGLRPVFAVVECIRSFRKARERERQLIAAQKAIGGCCLNRY